jgi:hypothetical protein
MAEGSLGNYAERALGAKINWSCESEFLYTCCLLNEVSDPGVAAPWEGDERRHRSRGRTEAQRFAPMQFGAPGGGGRRTPDAHRQVMVAAQTRLRPLGRPRRVHNSLRN